MRQMNDDLLARIIFREITVLSFFFSFTHIRPSQDLFLCTGIFDTFEINKGTYLCNIVFTECQKLISMLLKRLQIL